MFGRLTRPHRSRRAAALLAAALLAVPVSATAACGSGAAGSGGPVTVFAAASLSRVFPRIAARFAANRTGAAPRFSFAGSAALAAQLRHGAPADVFAAADAATMATVAAAGRAAATPRTFARNTLVIAVPAGNPRRLGALADLADPGVKVALCAAPVPCGAAARRALAAAGVRVTPVTWERDVTSALAKVSLGEVDAALVYRTDVRGNPRVAAVDFPEAARAVNDYQVTVLTGASDPARAAAFVDYLTSAAARSLLADAGFAPPVDAAVAPPVDAAVAPPVGAGSAPPGGAGSAPSAGAGSAPR